MIFTRIVDGPLTRSAEANALAEVGAELARLHRAGAVGAVLRFDGIVRRGEPKEVRSGEEGKLLALNYQTYEPMATRELETLARSVAAAHGLSSLVTLHSRGRVGVGEVSFVLMVTAPHRAETLAAVAEFIDRMKRDVPIWKWPVWDE